MNIRKATSNDAAAIAAIIVPIIREGTTYTLDPDMTERDAVAYWMEHDKETFVAEQNRVVLGTYYMRPNQAGGGRHVCNCGYMTDAVRLVDEVLRGACASIRWNGLARAAIEPCSSTSSSVRTSLPCDCGKH